MGPSTEFLSVLTDPSGPSSELRRILVVSGKVYYDLQKEIATANLGSQIKVVRVEELCPFPFSVLAETLQSYVDGASEPSQVEIFWVQEEARNQGPYEYVSRRIDSVLNEMSWEGKRLEYVGRRQMEVPAVGSPSLHARDKAAFLAKAITLN